MSGQIPADLVDDEGRINTVRAFEILHRNTAALEALAPLASEALKHKAECDEAKALFFRTMGAMFGSKGGRAVLTLVGVSFALACLKWAGLPVADALQLAATALRGHP